MKPAKGGRKALNSLLPTDDVLRSRGVAITSRCEFCSSIETIGHVCFSGAVAAQAWQFSLLPLVYRYVLRLVYHR